MFSMQYISLSECTKCISRGVLYMQLCMCTLVL